MQFTLKRIIATFICMLVMLCNAQVSRAEIRTYEGVGEYIMSDFETPNIAKQRAKARAEQHAAEQAGVYVKSYTRTVNNTLVEDEIVAIANMIIKIVDVQYITNPTSEAGGTLQIVAKIRVTVDSDRIDEWLKRDQQMNQEIVVQNKQLQADRAKLYAELTELRTKLAKVTSAQEKQNLEKKVISADSKFLLNQKIEKGWRLYDEGKYIESATVFSQAIEMDENNLKAYTGRASAYSRKGDYMQAIFDFTKVIAFNPTNANVYLGRGLTYYKKGDYKQAISDITKAINLNPKCAEAYNVRGCVYATKGNFTHAIADFSKSICFNSNYVEAYNNRGLAYAKQGNYIQAISDFTKAIDLNSNYVEAYNNRGYVYTVQGKYTQAIDDYNKAIAINPNHVKAYANRSVVNKHLGHIQQANEDFAKAKELSGR